MNGKTEAEDAKKESSVEPDLDSWFDPTLKFRSLPPVRWVRNAWFVLAAGSTFYSIWRGSCCLNWDPSLAGVHFFVFDVLRIPISLTIAAFSILALIGMAHRAEQSRIQIRNADKQFCLAKTEAQERKRALLFANSYKHRELFEKHIERIVKSYRTLGFKCDFLDLNFLYSKLYPEARLQNDIVISSVALKELDIMCKTAMSHVDKLGRVGELDYGRIKSSLNDLETRWVLLADKDVKATKIENTTFGDLEIYDASGRNFCRWFLVHLVILGEVVDFDRAQSQSYIKECNALSRLISFFSVGHTGLHEFSIGHGTKGQKSREFKISEDGFNVEYD